ncbi:MAG TPA: acyl-CoA dehydratase activase [Feifaniaceae bacterium]|nr:acyl-CoA dehydratase activase [Feifaniaceae bacterium]
MIEYVCKYAPVELLAGFGEESALCNLSAASLERADQVMHRNLCSFSRALIEHRMDEGEGACPLVLTNCCDSLRRTFDMLCLRGQKAFLLDLPHQDGPCARELYQNELIRFIEEFSAYSGKEFDCGKFRAACGKRPERPGGPYIALMGARMSDELFRYVQENAPLPVVNLMCTGSRRIGEAPFSGDIGGLMKWYAGELLSQTPCMRMTDIASRREQMNDPDIRGIIYNTVSFCDYYSFEYAGMIKELSVPVLKIETDFTVQSAAQLKNRLNAFSENLSLPGAGSGSARARGNAMDTRRFFAGIDSGSTSTNAVILDGERNIVSFSIAPTGVSVEGSAKKVFEEALGKAGLEKAQIERTVSTGYGRTGIRFSSRDITEITCHAKGAYFLNPRVRTVIDIGGQDSKIIRLDESGTVKDFAMNDKCAAGTGRFLEMMAQSLGLTLESMSVCGLDWEEEIVISSMCSVFAQSEVVSLIASGKKLPDIVRGLNTSIASRVIALGGRTGMEGAYMMTGGVAKNTGVVRAMEEKLGAPVLRPEEPELCGALGAALAAWEADMRSK